MPAKTAPLCVTIGGFDPSGGAGVLADVRTFEAFGCRGAAAITSLTFQNSWTFSGAEHVNATTLVAQFSSISDEDRIFGAKTGMLPTREIVEEVALLFHNTRLPAPVVDPVIESSTGGLLIDDSTIDVMLDEMLPVARLVTPNVMEAQRITNSSIVDEATMIAATEKIRKLGACAVLIKGGHLPQTDSREVIDVLNDAGTITVFRDDRIYCSNVRGTGCMLSAAIAAGLAKGTNLVDAVSDARAFVLEKLRQCASA